MKKLMLSFVCAASLLALTTSGTSKRPSYKESVSANDTLPSNDTFRANKKPATNDTFGGINSKISNNNLNPKKDSTTKVPPPLQ